MTTFKTKSKTANSIARPHTSHCEIYSTLRVGKNAISAVNYTGKMNWHFLMNKKKKHLLTKAEDEIMASCFKTQLHTNGSTCGLSRSRRSVRVTLSHAYSAALLSHKQVFPKIQAENPRKWNVVTHCKPTVTHAHFFPKTNAENPQKWYGRYAGSYTARVN